MVKTCKFPKCEVKALSRELCGGHYRQWWKGQELKPLVWNAAETTEERFWAKVIKTSECWYWAASKNAWGYGTFRGGKTKVYLAHRYAWELAGRVLDSSMVLDHICRNKLCVNPEHLRQITNKQNQENKSGANRNSSTGVRGVVRTANGKYQASVRHEGNRYHVGTFQTIEDAEVAVKAKRIELFTYNDADKG